MPAEPSLESPRAGAGPGATGRLRWGLKSLSLRNRITAGFILVVLVGTGLSTLVGSQIVTRAVLRQARERVGQALETAGLAYREHQERMARAVLRTATARRLTREDRVEEEIGGLLAEMREQSDLDLLRFVPSPGSGAETGSSPEAGDGDLPAAVKRALAGELVAGTGSLDALGHPAAPGDPGRFSSPRTELFLLAAAPVRSSSGITGVVYGGVRLAGNADLARSIQEIVFGGERYRGQDVGWVGFFHDGVEICTSRGTPGQEAGEKALPAEGAAAVLSRGETWFRRTDAAADRHLEGYEPIRDHSGEVVGVLAVGILEKPYLAVRTEMMLTFLAVALVAVIVLVALTFAITRNTIRPLEEMVLATQRISHGDLEQGVQVVAHDEIGVLAESFNRMLDSLKRMRGELEEWGRTLEQKVRERTDEIAAMQAQMLQSEKLASLGRMAAGVAHEINNPLGGILSFSMLALEELPVDHPVREDLETISRQALRCREIVAGLLEFSRNTQHSPGPTDAGSVLERTLTLLEKQASFQDVEVRRDIEDDLPLVRMDGGQLQQVITNLVLNGVDAMDGNGTLTIECRRAPAEDGIRLRIQDTGRGIPEDVLPYIFEPFFTTKKVGEGTGLGLAIVHGIVTRAGGRVEVDSGTPGTTFTVHLPFSPQEGDGDAA